MTAMGSLRTENAAMNTLVPISKLRSNTQDRNDMFSEKMEKIEQNMIQMFDKLLESPE